MSVYLLIYCIQANNLEKPSVFDRQVVGQQLKALQVFETVQLLQSGMVDKSVKIFTEILNIFGVRKSCANCVLIIRKLIMININIIDITIIS